MERDDAVRWLRRQKLRLASRGGVRKAIVPLVEVAEFSLSHGLREVLIRSRMRLAGRATVPSRPTYSLRPVARSTIFSLIVPVADRPRVTVVVPFVLEPGLAYRCIESVIQFTTPGTFEVVIAGDPSNAGVRELVEHVAGMRVVATDQGASLAEARNAGARAARGDIVCFLNPDTAVVGGCLAALLRLFDSDERVGAVGAKLVLDGGMLKAAGGLIWRSGDLQLYGEGDDDFSPPYEYVREVDFCPAAGLAVRRAVFGQLGGFDASLRKRHYDAADLACRLRDLGWVVLYQPAAVVVHELRDRLASTSSGPGDRERFAQRHAAALAGQAERDPRRLSFARDRRPGKRILLMDHMVPHYDQDSGSVRMMALLRILTELGHRVTFLPDNLARIEPYSSELQQLGIEVLYGPIPELDFVRRHGGDFDVVILCRQQFASRYLPALEDVGKRPYLIFDTVDLQFLREERLAELEGDPSLARAAARTRDNEVSVMKASDLVWVTSTHEAQLLRAELGIANVAVVPNIHDVRTGVPPFRDRKDLLFIGGFRHPPNEDAVVFFVEEVWPLVRAELPGVKFLVVGSHVPPIVQGLAGPGVEVLGYVEDVRPVFDACRLSVAPLRYGAGVKGKVTQSLAWGVPAVATPQAAEGLPLRDRHELMIASDPAEFARRVVELYRDETVWTRLSENGRQAIAAHLGHDAVRETVKSILAAADRLE